MKAAIGSKPLLPFFDDREAIGFARQSIIDFGDGQTGDHAANADRYVVASMSENASRPVVPSYRQNSTTPMLA